MTTPTGDLIVDSLRAQASTGTAVGVLAKNVGNAINAVAGVVMEEITHRQELQQATSVLLQRAGIQSLESNPVVGKATIQTIQATQATVGAVVATGTIHG
ncbi:MAG: hypothetical protein V4536_08780 [Pseudomonadota bacterium]